MKKSIIYLVTAIIILVIAVLTWQYIKQSSNNPKEKSIVVLPFSSDNTDSTNVILTPEEEQLLGKLKTADSLTYYIHPKGYQNFADSLWGKNYVILESSILDKNDSVEIRLQLMDYETGDSIWTKTFMSGKEELSEIHNKILRELTEAEIKF